MNRELGTKTVNYPRQLFPLQNSPIFKHSLFLSFICSAISYHSHISCQIAPLEIETEVQFCFHFPYV